jgi:hypothetical protein
MKQKHSWRQKPLEILENHYWGDLETAPTGLIKRCIELSRVPVCEFTLDNLRLMIGQQLGLSYLAPLALEKLGPYIFVSAALYEGDLLESMLRIDSSFWEKNKEYRAQLNSLVTDHWQKITEFGLETGQFAPAG